MIYYYYKRKKIPYVYIYIYVCMYVRLCPVYDQKGPFYYYLVCFIIIHTEFYAHPSFLRTKLK
jgi:hypothetical protein